MITSRGYFLVFLRYCQVRLREPAVKSLGRKISQKLMESYFFAGCFEGLMQENSITLFLSQKNNPCKYCWVCFIISKASVRVLFELN